MMKRIEWSGIALLALGALMAASAGAQTTDSTGRMNGRRNGRPGRTAAGEVISRGVPAAEAAMIRRMSDANIVDGLAGDDSVEIQQAMLAQTRATDPAIRDFATMLVNDHTKSLNTDRKLAGARDIGRAAMPGDTTTLHMEHVLDRLQSMPAGAEWDRAFIRAQVMHHHMALQTLPLMRQKARDDDLQQHISADLPVIQKHYDRAVQLAQSHGMGNGMRGMRGMNGMRDSTGMRSGTQNPPF